MIHRAFKYSPLMGIALLVLHLGFLAFMGYIGSFFFDSVIARTPFDHLRSEWVRWMFILTGVFLGMRFLTMFIPERR